MLQVFEEFGVDPAECENSDTGSGVSAAGEPHAQHVLNFLIWHY